MINIYMRFHFDGLDIKSFYLILNINSNINLNFCMGIKRPASLNSFRSHRERAGPQCTIDLSQIYWLSCALDKATPWLEPVLVTNRGSLM